MEAKILDILLILNTYLIVLARTIDDLINYINSEKVKKFLQFYYNLNSYIEELFLLFRQLQSNDIFIRIMKKKVLKAAQVLKNS